MSGGVTSAQAFGGNDVRFSPICGQVISARERVRGLQNSTRVWRGNIGRQIAKVRRGALLARRSHDGILAARQADVTLTVHGQRPVSSALPAAVVYLGQLARGDKVGDFVGTRTDHLCCPFSLFDGILKPLRQKRCTGFCFTSKFHGGVARGIESAWYGRILPGFRPG